MKRQLFKQCFVMLCAFFMSTVAYSATAVTIPTTNAVDWNNADISNCKIENSGANVGSTGSKTVVTFEFENAISQDYLLSFKTGSKNAAKLQVEFYDASKSYLSQNITVSNTGSWTPTEVHAFLLESLPVGTFTLKLSVTEASSYAGNWGELTVSSFSDYMQIPSDDYLDLNRGTYNGAKVENGGANVGYITNNCSASYSFYNVVEGVHKMLIDICRYNIGGTMNIVITDAISGNVEYDSDYVIASDAPGSYTTNEILLDKMSKGVKTMTLTFSNGSSYICNFKNIKFEVAAASKAQINSIAIEGQVVTQGASTDWMCLLPKEYASATTTFSVSSDNCSISVSAQTDLGEEVDVTCNGDGSYTLPTPDAATGTTITLMLTASEDVALVRESYTLYLFHLASLTMTQLTIDGIAVDLLDAMNSDAHLAQFEDNVYTTIPSVKATFIDGSTATGVVAEQNGTEVTYELTGTLGDESVSYILIIDGCHVYEKGANDEVVQLKYTSDGKSGDGTWSNGVYTLTTNSLDGWNNSSFKLNGSDFVWSVPANIQVKQVIFKSFNANYNAGTLTSLTSEGASAIYIPAKHDYQEPDATAYDLIINIEGHKPGTPVCFSLQGGGQPVAWFELVVEQLEVTTPPAVQALTVTPTQHKNHCVVAVTFDREMKETSATIGDQTIVAEGGSSVLYFPVWDLSYNTSYTFKIPAGAAADTYGNVTTETISQTIEVGSPAVVSKKHFDYVVSNADEFCAAVVAVNQSNTSATSTRKIIFIKNGDYDLGETGQQITGYNVSLIGESRDGVIVHGNRTGISNPVLNLRDRTGFYLQDLTVRNDLDYGANEFKGVGVAVYGGNKTIMKNVRLLSNQDTQVTGETAYLVDCEIHGTVDFICGGGDNFFDRCHLVLENRGGNCICAPATNATMKWGYVFSGCTISAMTGATQVVDGSYSLGRPWLNEPRAYYLNTTMNVLPSVAGWTSMSDLPTHFYEYNSVKVDGSLVDLSDRTNSPTSTNSYSPILSAEEAAKFTERNVLGGVDSWLPTEECVSLSAPMVEFDGNVLKISADDAALCWVVLRDGQYCATTIENTYTLTDEGTYTVRAANAHGGLGETSAQVVYNHKTSLATTSVGWSTGCFPVAVQVPEGTKAYYVSSITSDNELVLSRMTSIPAGEGFIFNAKEGDYEFTASEKSPDAISNLLVGTLSSIEVEPSSIMVLGKIDAGTVGFMNYTASQLAAQKAYLPKTLLSAQSISTARFVFSDTTGIDAVMSASSASTIIYNLQGERVEKMMRGNLYIVGGKKVKY